MKGSNVMLTFPHFGSGHITVLRAHTRTLTRCSIQFMPPLTCVCVCVCGWCVCLPFELALEEVDDDGSVSLEVALPGLPAHLLVRSAVALLDLHVGLVQNLVDTTRATRIMSHLFAGWTEVTHETTQTGGVLG